MPTSRLPKENVEEQLLAEVRRLEDLRNGSKVIVKLPSGRQHLDIAQALRHSLCRRVAAEVMRPHHHNWVAFLEMIIGEAVTNAFVHSDQETPIEVDYVVTDDEVCFRIHNFSHETPVADPHLPDEQAEGGFGEVVIQELASEIKAAVDYKCIPKGQQNEIIFVCSLTKKTD